jgi:hypothetical protein
MEKYGRVGHPPVLSLNSEFDNRKALKDWPESASDKGNMNTTKAGGGDLSLVECFVASFATLDEMSADEVDDPIGWELSVGELDEYGFKRWQPLRVDTPWSALEDIYAKLPGRFPPLYEQLILSYRWGEVDLETYRLLANPPTPNLSGLLGEMSKDPALWKHLLANGYIQFGMGPDTDYDPVCFDVKSRNESGDCRIVKLDHEEILCNERTRVVAELAPTFESLLVHTIEVANRRAG